MKQYFKDIFQGVWTVLIGMKITFKHLFTPAVTIQYPDVKLKLPERARNRLYVNMDDCIGCFQCDMACPVNCFKIETIKSLPTEDLGMTSTGQKKRLWVTEFDIDIAKCCYCGLCVYPCPTECIKMTDVYEFSEFDRHNLIYNYATVTPAEAVEIKARAGEYEKEQAAKKAAAAQAAAAAKAAAPAVPPVAKPPEAPPASTPPKSS
ncbi:MAG TPA: NADH-quinone oxidoreductase subunit I [Bacteroidota bacterium]|nr:NADH-quinone oxidoreductase subunit I [Bacteroidota bacterium]